MHNWKTKAQELEREVYTLYFIIRHPQTPWYAKALAGLVVSYAFSPIDLIPDFIPVLGYLDDVVLIPLGVLVVRALVSNEVLAASRIEARHLSTRPRSILGAVVIIGIWIGLVVAAVCWLKSFMD